MKEVTMTMLIFKVLIRAFGMLFFDRLKCTSFEDTETKTTAPSLYLFNLHKWADVRSLSVVFTVYFNTYRWFSWGSID